MKVQDAFAAALKLVLEHEGGYVNHPKDPGGETNHGVTKHVAEENGYHGDMREIPDDVVEKIYRTKYWDKISGDLLPYPIALVTFDAAVNSGVSRASKWLQRALEVTDDGSIGPATVQEVNTCDVVAVARACCDQRLSFLRALPTFDTFGKGWTSRVDNTLAAAVAASV